MAMTERTTESIDARKRAEKIVDRFIAIVMAGEQDIAWEGSGIIGRLVDFEGEIPRSSGYHEVCRMANACDRMQAWPEDFSKAHDYMMQLSANRRQALILDRAYRGRTKWKATDPFHPEKPVYKLWDDEACAAEAGCKVQAFIQRVSDAYKILERMTEALNKKAA